jgi:hypothetical protein
MPAVLPAPPAAVHVRPAVARLGALEAWQPRVLAAHTVHAVELLLPRAAGGEALEHGSEPTPSFR